MILSIRTSTIKSLCSCSCFQSGLVTTRSSRRLLPPSSSLNSFSSCTLQASRIPPFTDFGASTSSRNYWTKGNNLSQTFSAFTSSSSITRESGVFGNLSRWGSLTSIIKSIGMSQMTLMLKMGHQLRVSRVVSIAVIPIQWVSIVCLTLLSFFSQKGQVTHMRPWTWWYLDLADSQSNLMAHKVGFLES